MGSTFQASGTAQFSPKKASLYPAYSISAQGVLSAGRQGSLFSSGSLFSVPEDQQQHVEKEEELCRAICTIFNSDSESEEDSCSKQAAKKRRCSQAHGKLPGGHEGSESSNQSEGSIIRDSLGFKSANAIKLSSQEGSISGSLGGLSSCSTPLGHESGDEQRSRKHKVEWTQELHERFVNAVETLGADKAVPSKILEHMGPIAAGLTRQNVASHLQKHRTRRRSQNDFCKAAPYCPPAAYHCWSPFSPPGAMIGMQPHMMGAPVCGMPAMAWPVAMPMIPNPSPQPPLSATINAAIADAISKPMGGKPPLGLKLDTKQVLDAISSKGLQLHSK
ncbi:hypothetical protein CVIRNUC_005469 [Coccomyxa viridis]|uniref:HTH myb-type domain-containing protein n=1 Tax=Coccomyxa viridis TaxID=1274662 RepID=A0AAV1I5Z3_9CHLO|nr:hypothetical protein CVIRNUC_005469 [Coccomyxa viridis]